jgi:non-ribosomal peptide synthetase component E (peptide arylation enzyme)
VPRSWSSVCIAIFQPSPSPPTRLAGTATSSRKSSQSLTGWGGYRTGDLGYLDEDRHLVYVGRRKHIIRRGGVTVAPSEIEPVLMRHQAVHEAAVVPLPDERLGERACAALIVESWKRAPTLPELQELLEREGLAKYMWPESSEVFEEFPRTPSLKVVKREVVREIVARAGAPLVGST